MFCKSAEDYLTAGEGGEATDAESVVTTGSELSSNYGKLKHSDSLLLLTQVRPCYCSRRSREGGGKYEETIIYLFFYSNNIKNIPFLL